MLPVVKLKHRDLEDGLLQWCKTHPDCKLEIYGVSPKWDIAVKSTKQYAQLTVLEDLITNTRWRR